MANKLRILIISFVFVSYGLIAGEMKLVGQYHGKDLYIQNPFHGSSTTEYCIQSIFVNGKERLHPQQGAFIVSLNHLKQNDPVEIVIVHKDGCKPRILNASAFATNKAFKFESFDVGIDAITWTATGEKPMNTYVIEHFVNNSWSELGKVQSKGNPGVNSYSYTADHHSGSNKYRIKYLERTGQVYHTVVKEFKSDLEAVTFYPTRVKDKIYLSREVNYEILDQFGKAVKKGRAKEVDCNDLKSGQVYYLVVDNRTESFFKK
jgi:hypothetical protein